MTGELLESHVNRPSKAALKPDHSAFWRAKLLKGLKLSREIQQKLPGLTKNSLENLQTHNTCPIICTTFWELFGTLQIASAISFWGTQLVVLTQRKTGCWYLWHLWKRKIPIKKVDYTQRGSFFLGLSHKTSGSSSPCLSDQLHHKPHISQYFSSPWFAVLNWLHVISWFNVKCKMSSLPAGLKFLTMQWFADTICDPHENKTENPNIRVQILHLQLPHKEISS